MENISATAKNRRGLQIVFALTFAYFIVEVAGGIFTNSLALLADAAHMLTDVFGLGLALFATCRRSRRRRKRPMATIASRF